MKKNWVEIFTEDQFTEEEFTASKVSVILTGDYTVHVRHAIIDWMIRHNITKPSISIVCNLMETISTEYVQKLDDLIDIVATCKATKKHEAAYCLVQFMAFGPSNVREVVDLLCEKQDTSCDMYRINNLVRSREELIDIDACRVLVSDVFLESLPDGEQGITSYMYGNAITRFLTIETMLNICPAVYMHKLVYSLVNDRSLAEQAKPVITDNSELVCDALVAHKGDPKVKMPVLLEVLALISTATNFDKLLTLHSDGVRILASKELDWNEVQNSLQAMTIPERAALFRRKDVPRDFVNKNAGVQLHATLIMNRGYES